MKIKLDENLPGSLSSVLAALGHDVETVQGERLQGASDSAVWTAAQREGRLLITQDIALSDVRFRAPGTHAGLLLVRLAAPSRRELEVYVSRLFREDPVESWAGCLVVATDAKVRVRRPRSGD